MYNDADIEMAEMRQAGNDVANGVCPRCTDVLDPTNPKWDMGWLAQRRFLAAVGPHSNVVDGYHDRCIESPDFW